MSDGGKLSAGDFGVAFKGFLEQSVAQAPVQEPFFRARLTDHFGVVPTALPIVAEQFPKHNYPNVQIAIEGYLAEDRLKFQLLGVASEQTRMMESDSAIWPPRLEAGSWAARLSRARWITSTSLPAMRTRRSHAFSSASTS